MKSISSLHSQIMHCSRCPRLRRYCEKIAQEKRKAYLSDTYWGRPVPGFGDPKARLFVLGLAPAAHGANRTGRIFTGDRSGEWLYRALHRAGFANQPTSTSREDGLKLKDAYVSCVVHCAPPENKPSRQETAACLPYLEEELMLFPQARVFLVLGKFAFDALWRLLGQKGHKKPVFKHGAVIRLPSDGENSGKTLILSFHPSQQNTFTGRLTESQFDRVFEEAKKALARSP